MSLHYPENMNPGNRIFSLKHCILFYNQTQKKHIQIVTWLSLSYPSLLAGYVSNSVNASCCQTRREYHFYRAMLCIRGTSHGPVSVGVCVCLCLSVCLSVCLSQAGVLLKPQNVGSHKQHHTIPPGTLVF